MCSIGSIQVKNEERTVFDWIFGSVDKRSQQLIAAIASGDVEKVRKLLKNSLDINFVDPESGETA